MTQEVLRTRPAADWLERLTAEGVPCAPVLTRSRMIDHPQVVANGVVIETEHPGAGLVRQARPAARFSGTPTGVRRGAPELGEHTDEILAEIGSPRTRSHDRLLLLADTERVEGVDHAGGMRSAVPHGAGEHRQGRSVQAGVPGDQSEQSHAGDRG